MTNQVFEPVLTVHHWWDVPRSGLVRFRGKPHLYRCSWDDAADDWSEVYTLTPLDPDTASLLLEDYDIWRRWRLAFDAGKVAVDSGPALPKDKARWVELRQPAQVS